MRLPWILCAAASWLAACSEAKDVVLTAEEAERNPSKVVMARIGPDVLTLADVTAAIAQRGALAQERYLAPQTQFAFLDSLVDFEVLAREAERQGLLDSPRVRRALKTTLAGDLWRKGALAGADRSSLTDAALRQYHQRHAAEFREPDSAVAAHILVALGEGAPLAARLKAREGAEALRKALGPKPDAARFAEEARRSSGDPATKDKGGALSLLASQGDEGDVPEELLVAAFKQPLGEVALVETPLGAHLLRVERRTVGQAAPYEAVRKQVEARLWRSVREAAWRRHVEARKLSASLQYDEEVLRRVDAEVSAQLVREAAARDGGAQSADGGAPQPTAPASPQGRPRP